jgi:uncharacterized protein YkwD
VAGEPPLPVLHEELERLHELVNEARSHPRSCGDQPFAATAPLLLDVRLVVAAQEHSDDMHAAGFVGHVGSDDSTLRERVERQGYDWWRIAENVARGQRSADQVMAGWLASAGHCANLMNPEFQHLGLGLAGTSWTQVFAQPR